MISKGCDSTWSRWLALSSSGLVSNRMQSSGFPAPVGVWLEDRRVGAGRLLAKPVTSNKLSWAVTLIRKETKCQCHQCQDPKEEIYCKNWEQKGWSYDVLYPPCWINKTPATRLLLCRLGPTCKTTNYCVTRLSLKQYNKAISIKKKKSTPLRKFDKLDGLCPDRKSVV